MGKTKRAARPERAVAVFRLQPQLVHVAAQQLAATPGGPLAWIVNFARQDPSGWLPTDLEGHRHRLLAFVSPRERETISTGLLPPDVLALHKRVRDFLRDLVGVPAGQRVKIPTNNLRVTLVRSSAPGEKPSAFHLSRSGPLEALVLQTVADLVVSSGRLLSCRYCGLPFLALRKSLFCTPKCAQRWHDREKVKAKAPKKEDKR